MDINGLVIAAIVGIAAISIASIALAIHVQIYIAKQSEEFPRLIRRIGELNRRIRDFEIKFGRRVSSIESRLNQMDERVKQLQNENAEIRDRIQRAHQRIDDLALQRTRSFTPKQQKGRYANDTSSRNTR